MKRETTKKTGGGALLFLCWFIYSCGYLGKVNYSANITQIEQFFNISHAEAGLVSTCLFFSYGAGQIFNGIFCIKYNIKWVTFGGVMLSALANLGVALTDNFTIVKYLWLLNGVGLSVLWPTLIRLLSETLSKKDMAKASMTMGTTVATGTLTIYALSALFAAFDAFRLSFIVPAIILPIVGVVWLVFYRPFTERAKTSDEAELAVATGQVRVEASKDEKKSVLTTVVIFTFFAVITNLVQDGLTTWLPTILKETYHLDDSLSILLTLCLPIMGLFSNIFAVSLHGKVKNFVLDCGIVLFVSGAMIVASLGLLHTNLFVLTLICFMVARFLAGSSNSTITSFFPLFMKGKGNSGLLAGILNGCCYIGSTLSAYGLGLVADTWSWSAVFILLACACAFVVVVSLAYTIFMKTKKEKPSLE